MSLGACRQDADAARAARGEIDRDAPVIAHASLMIDAPPDIVWALLADIGHWPDWQHDIDRATADGPPGPGARFSWTTGSGTIHSRIAVFEPDRRLAWTGRLFLFHAVHVWTLAAAPGDGTMVETDESMSGWPIAWLFSSQALTETDQAWLAALKRAAEARRHG